MMIRPRADNSSGRKKAVVSNGGYPEINISHIRAGGGVAGLIFTVGCLAIFLIGIPWLWFFLVSAIALGTGIGTVMHLLHREL
jgi:hypothetical protein